MCQKNGGFFGNYAKYFLGRVMLTIVAAICYNKLHKYFGERYTMISFSEVTKSYSVGTQALRGEDLQIEDGEFAFLVGPSGSGKSPLSS